MFLKLNLDLTLPYELFSLLSVICKWMELDSKTQDSELNECKMFLKINLVLTLSYELFSLLSVIRK